MFHRPNGNGPDKDQRDAIMTIKTHKTTAKTYKMTKNDEVCT